MAIQQVSPSQKTKVNPGRKSGGVMGQKVGAGLGAVIGGVTGGVAGAAAGGPAAAAWGAAKGAGQGMLTGAGMGQVAGDLLQPGVAGSVTQTARPGVNTVQTAMESQQMLDGLRALEDLSPELQQKYAGTLTKGYIASMARLKTGGQV